MRNQRAAWVVLAALLALGCDDVKVPEVLNQPIQKIQETIKEPIQQVQQQVKQQLNLAGSMNLNLNPPVQTKACYAPFIADPTGNKGLLQLKSYESEATETFPSVFLQADVPASDPQELVGQTLSAAMHVQSTADGPILTSAANPVQIKVTGLTEKILTLELVQGSLVNIEGGAAIPVSGTLEGVLQ